MSLKTMMFKKVKAINFEKLDKLSSDIAKRNNKSKGYVKRDMIKNFIKYGIYRLRKLETPKPKR